MVGVASLPNDAAPLGKKISLYYNQANFNLALEQRSESSSTAPPVDVYVSSATSLNGIIENPSQIAAADFDGLKLVFGFTSKKADPDGKPETQHDVSIVSPIYRPVGATLKSNKTITTASHDGSASVFYLTGGGGNDVQIQEVVIGAHKAKDWANTTKILESSSLAAYYADESSGPIRRIIYQAVQNGDLYDYEPNDGPKKIAHAKARKGSPLAITVANGKAYLYYVNANDQLEKIIKSDIATPSSSSWGNNDNVKSEHTVNIESQITVVSAGGQNHVFFASGPDGTNFEHVTDAW